MKPDEFEDAVNRYLSLIPKDSLKADQIEEVVLKMKPGEKRTFRFDPRDTKLCGVKELQYFQAALDMKVNHILTGSYEVDVRRGKYFYTIVIGAKVGK